MKEGMAEPAVVSAFFATHPSENGKACAKKGPPSRLNSRPEANKFFNIEW